MSAVENFIATPSLESLGKLSKEQLLQVSEHFSVVVLGDKRLKENIKDTIRAELVGSGWIPEDKPVLPTCSLVSSFIQTLGLTFEQQKELLVLQFENQKNKHKLEIKKQIEFERMHQEMDRAKMDLERSRLAMIKDGTLGGEARGGPNPGTVPRFDINSLRLLPQFNEQDPDTFLSFI